VSEPERYLVVSLGSIGRRHLGNLRRLRPDARIGVLRLAARPGEGGPPEGADDQFHDIRDAIAFAPRAAIVASPASAHLGVAKRLAEAGTHLFLEKPIADRAEGVANLVDGCAARGLVLMVGYNLRFHPSLLAMKQAIDAGAIGRVLGARAEVGQYLPDWRPGSDYRRGVTARAELGGGVLLELSHELDYLQWLLGRPRDVSARGGRLGDLEIDVEDMVELTLGYDRPLLASVHLDMLQRAPTRQCRVIGTEGTLLWDGIADKLDIYRAAEPGWREVPVTRLSDRNQMYLDELDHFLGCVDTSTRPRCDGRDGLAVLEIVEAARQSMATGHCITLNEEAHA
jgi:predicted dehydrogenase